MVMSMPESEDSSDADVSEVWDIEKGAKVAADADGGWDWVFDEAAASREREEAAERAKQAASSWELTQQSSSKLKGHLSTLDEDPGPIDFEPVGERGGRRKVAIAEGSAAASHSVQIVGEKMLHKEQRLAKVDAAHTAQREEEVRKRAKLQEKIAVSEARCAEQQGERLAAERRRAFNSAQRASEQQKQLKEFRREKERIWEAYYQKRQQKLQAGGDSPTSAAAAGGSSEAAQLGDEPLEEDVLSVMTRSHRTYADELQKWHALVGENERRAEAEWSRILGGKSKEDLLLSEKFRRRARDLVSMRSMSVCRRRSEQPGSASSSISGLQAFAALGGRTTGSEDAKDATFASTGTSPSNGRSFGPGGTSPSNARLSGTSPSNARPPHVDFDESQSSTSYVDLTLRPFGTRTATETLSPFFPSSPNGGGSFSRMSSARLSSIATSHWTDVSEIQRAAAEEKGRQQEAAVSEAQRRKTKLLKEQAAKLSRDNAEWTRRNQMAATRRSEAATFEANSSATREGTLQQRQKEEADRREAMRKSRSLAQAKQEANVQAFQAAKEERLAQTMRELKDKSDAATSERVGTFNTDHEARMDKAKYYADVLNNAGRKKKTDDEGFRRRTQEELQAKADKANRVLHQKRCPAFQREREFRREHSSSPGSTVTSPGTSPKGVAGTTGRLQPSLLTSASAPALLRPSALPPVQRRMSTASDEESEEEDNAEVNHFLAQVSQMALSPN